MHVIVLGIDPGVANTGYGVVAQQRGRMFALDGGVVETRAGAAEAARLAIIHERVGALMDEYRPDAVAIEDLYFGANARSALAVGQARGVVLLAAGQRGLPCGSYTPQQVKSAVCGSGRAEKAQVQGMVQRLLSLAELPHIDDAADALAVAICHLNRAPLAAALGGRHDRAPRGPRSRSAAPTTSSSRAAASATGSPSPRRRCGTCRGWGRRPTLFTHLIVREDAMLLYGFATEEERDLFLMLIRRAVGRAQRWRSPCCPAARRASCSARWRPATPRGSRRRPASASAPPSGSSWSCAEVGPVFDDPIVITRGGDDPRTLAREGLVGLGFTSPRRTGCSRARRAGRPRT